MSNLIDKQAAIDLWDKYHPTIAVDAMQYDAELRQLPPAQPQRTGKCMWCERLKERNLRIEYYWIDEEGCTASFSEPHIVATGIAKFCPNCGSYNGGENEI